MSLIQDAFEDLYSENSNYELFVTYTAKFKPYNANVRMRHNHIQFNLSKKWKTVSREIQIGLLQELLLKILKNRLEPKTKNTTNIEMYNIFMQKIHFAAPKTKFDPALEESFDRVNKKYFNELIEKTNLVWGSNSASRLGSYEYGSDTITISKILRNAPIEMLDYIVYHEMLHKKHKFYKKNQRSFHHTTKFRKDERAFENSELLDKQLKSFLRSKRRNVFFQKLYIQP